MGMKPDKPQGNTLNQSIKPSEPTIWALRKPAPGNHNATLSPKGTLYEHLFGYDPIRVTSSSSSLAPKPEDIYKGSAGNPQLNIINPATNFLVKDLSSDQS